MVQILENIENPDIGMDICSYDDNYRIKIVLAKPEGFINTPYDSSSILYANVYMKDKVNPHIEMRRGFFTITDNIPNSPLDISAAFDINSKIITPDINMEDEIKGIILLWASNDHKKYHIPNWRFLQIYRDFYNTHKSTSLQISYDFKGEPVPGELTTTYDLSTSPTMYVTCPNQLYHDMCKFYYDAGHLCRNLTFNKVLIKGDAINHVRFDSHKEILEVLCPCAEWDVMAQKFVTKKII